MSACRYESRTKAVASEVGSVEVEGADEEDEVASRTEIRRRASRVRWRMDGVDELR